MTAAVERAVPDDRVDAVLKELEARSRKEQQQLEELRAAGGTALREQAASFMLDVGPEAGQFLNTLVRGTRARIVLEVGGSVGYSTVWLAEAVRATGGRLYSIEVDPEKRAEQHAFLTSAGLREYVELTGLEAPELVPTLPGPVDLVLLDHWKELYPRDFDATWAVLRPGGLVVADNIVTPRKNAAVIAAYQRHVAGVPDAQSQVLAVGDGLEITVKREAPLCD
ncbi:class I SAM-dependent methyltransferase [Streptomyces sp. HNM0574]|uniref:O-methyltransferase n=1 Tax=Streptomyces sp. HNM0574 TaxID=2714954 RepID=UPI00146CEE34|nr:class I SAM-dependent methyltransferase [Streptomyces sp. HNM0574]NLU68946.1 O-methyltransferase [Streptomyces sp. HNM0574]